MKTYPSISRSYHNPFEVIDKRTKFGQDIVIKVKSMKTETNEDLHPGLVSLRIKDLNRLFNIGNN